MAFMENLFKLGPHLENPVSEVQYTCQMCLYRCVPVSPNDRKYWGMRYDILYGHLLISNGMSIQLLLSSNIVVRAINSAIKCYHSYQENGKYFHQYVDWSLVKHNRSALPLWLRNSAIFSLNTPPTRLLKLSWHYCLDQILLCAGTYQSIWLSQQRWQKAIS